MKVPVGYNAPIATRDFHPLKGTVYGTLNEKADQTLQASLMVRHKLLSTGCIEVRFVGSPDDLTSLGAICSQLVDRLNEIERKCANEKLTEQNKISDIHQISHNQT